MNDFGNWPKKDLDTVKF
jgi:hypothetical protein